MKFCWLALVFALVLPSFCRAQDDPALDLVKSGFTAYQKSSPRAGFEAWFKDSRDQTDTISSYVNVFAGQETFYGKVDGWELIRELEASASVRFIYVVCRCEKRPLYMSFECYRSEKGWIITSLNHQAKLQDILEPNLSLHVLR